MEEKEEKMGEEERRKFWVSNRGESCEFEKKSVCWVKLCRYILFTCVDFKLMSIFILLFINFKI